MTEEHPAPAVALIGDDLVEVWPCCEDCEHDQTDTSQYHTEPCEVCQ